LVWRRRDSSLRRKLLGGDLSEIIDVQTGGTVWPGPSPFEPDPFEPDLFEPELITGLGRVARRAAYAIRAWHYTGPSVSGWPGKHDP
jgi:hypothetical protein